MYRPSKRSFCVWSVAPTNLCIAQVIVRRCVSPSNVAPTKVCIAQVRSSTNQPTIPQAVCPIDSAAVKGITAQQVMYVRPGEWYRRPSMCFVVDLHVTTAVLIHLLGGHLLVDDTLASWVDVLRRRYWYIHLLGGHLLVDDTLTLVPQAVCPIDSAAVKGITAQQTVQVNGIAAQACASWLTYMLRRRYWYIYWADTSWLTIHLPLGRTYYDGGTDTYICWANTSWLTIHLHLPLGRTYMLRRRYISWADNTHILRRSRIAYTLSTWANIT